MGAPFGSCSNSSAAAAAEEEAAAEPLEVQMACRCAAASERLRFNAQVGNNALVLWPKGLAGGGVER